jgi:hypothetical protein
MGNALRALRHGTHPPKRPVPSQPGRRRSGARRRSSRGGVFRPGTRWVDRLLHVIARSPPDIDDAAAAISAPSPAWNRDDVL